MDTLIKPVDQMAQNESEGVCIHYWIIDPPEGPVSKGRCKKCGEVRDFNNYVGYSTWENEPSIFKKLGIDLKEEVY